MLSSDIILEPLDSRVKCCRVTAEPREIVHIADDAGHELQANVEPTILAPTEPATAPDPMDVEPADPPQAPVSQVPVLPAAPPLPPQTTFYPLYLTPEDQIGAAKEAMIQAEHMMRHTKEAYEASKEAYDASSALRANVRVSTVVSSFLI